MKQTIRNVKGRSDGLLRTLRSSLLWSLLARQRRLVQLMFLLFVVVAIASLQVAQLTVGMIDRAIVEQTAPLWPFVPRIVAWSVVLMLVIFAMAQVTAKVGYQLEFELRVWLYTRVQAAEAARLDAVASGQLVTRALTDLQLVEQTLQYAPSIVGFVPLLLGMTIFIAVLSPLMAIVAVAALPINLWLIRRFRHRLWVLSWAELNERAEVMSAIDEPVRGIRVVKAFGREEHERVRVADACLRAYRFAMTRVRLLARYELVLKAVPYIFNAAVLAAGAHLIAADRLSLGAFLLAFQLSQLLTGIATIFAELASAWQYLRTSSSRLLDLLALGVAPPGREGARLPDVTSGLMLSGIGVDLGGRTVLDSLDLTVAPGELVVVTGAPSSGKSTLAAVAAGLLPFDRGSVRLDGAELAELDPAALREVVRIVSEETILFATSLRDNLLMGSRHDADDDAIRAAIHAAAAEDVVESVAGGLDGEIGDRGLTLSGGQRQRLALARALVTPPRLLVLDDALAAVNPSLEAEILRRIRAHASRTAILCITRRPSLAAIGDRHVELPRPELGQHAPLAEAVTAPAPAAAGFMAPMLDDIAALRLSDERPDVDEGLVLDDRRPGMGTVVRPFAGILVLALVALVLHAGGQLAPEALFGAVANVVEDGTAEADRRAALLVVIGIAFGISAYAFRILAQRLNQGIVYLLRRRIFRRLSRLGIDFYDRELPGQVAARVVHDLDQILTFVQNQGFRMIVYLMQFAVGMALIIAISPAAAPVVLGMAVAIIAATAIQLPFAMRAFGWARDELGRVTSKFEEDFNARAEIRRLGAEELQLDKFVAASWQRRRARWWSATLGNALSAWVQFVGNVGAALVLYRSGNLVLAAELSIGAALSLRLLSTAATQPLAQVGDQYKQFLEVRVSWNRLRQPFDVEVLPQEVPAPARCDSISGSIRFDHVAFRYPSTGRTVLHDVSFELQPGRVTALVGYTGAGKSSIAKLLARMYDPDEGAVLVDGVDLRTLELGSYRRRLGIVPQDAFLFKGTVASNIAYGRPDAPRGEIEAAAWAVGAGELLESLPDGFDHVVEEEGRNLSAARRQLIALARAWLAAPDVLVLDEATSCLDAELEEAVLRALQLLGRTTLMITHREEVALQADDIVVLDEGRVVQAGSAGEVAAEGGAFSRLWHVATVDGAPAPVGLITAGAPRTRAALYELARQQNIRGRSRMSVDELVAALEDAEQRRN